MKTRLSSCLKPLAFSILAISAPSLHALTVTPLYDASINNQPNAAALKQTITDALAVYQTNVTNTQSFSISFKLSASVSGAQSDYFAMSVPFSAYRAALVSRQTSATDTTVLANIGAGPNDPVVGASTVDLSEALAVTLGIAGASFTSATVTFNLADYKVNPAGFLGTIQHEVDEVLGMSSNLPNNTGSATLPTTVAPADLFRYSSTGANSPRSFTLNLAQNSNTKAYFRLGPNSPVLQQFNSLPNGGDYGDWYTENDRIFAVAPQDQSGDSVTFTSLLTSPNFSELTMLDAIGYTITAVPEPTSLGLLASTALLGGMLRRKRAGRA